MLHDPTLLYTVENTLCEHERWHADSIVTLTVHIQERTTALTYEPLQAAIDLMVLVRFASEALSQRNVEHEGRELLRVLRHALYILNNVSYHSMLSHYDREGMHLIAEHMEDHIESMSGALT